MFSPHYHITFEKYRKHTRAARVSYIYMVFSNARRVLSQCNTQLRLLYLLNTTLVYSIIPFITENRVHEAGYFHALSRRSKLTVNLVQLSELGQSADGMEPVLQAMNEIKRFQPDVILLYTKDKNIGLFVQQVIAEHYMGCFYLNTSPKQRFLLTWAIY